MRIQVLPAENGDCILVEHAPGHYFLIDGGYVDTVNSYLGPKLDEMAVEGGVIDVMVVTHIDSDHISGILKLMEGELPVPVGEIWYNGYRHIQSTAPVTAEKEWVSHKDIAKELNPSPVMPMGGLQGCTLSALIAGKKIPWNVPADGGAMKAPMSFQVGETRVHLLSPNQRDLDSLEKRWRKELVDKHLLDEAHSQEYWDDAFEWTIASEENKQEGFLEHAVEADMAKNLELSKAMPKNCVEEALEKKYKADGSAANGSSISFVLETPDGARALLLGDAHAESVIDSLKALYGETGEKYHFDVVKLAHHGSFNNTSPALLDLIDSDKWLVSTNGKTFHHPDMPTLANIVTRGKDNKLFFNYEMDICQELRKDEYRQYGFKVVTPEGEEGISVTVGEAFPDDAELTGKPTIINESVLDFLTKRAKESPRLRMNLDLRNTPEDKSQRMLNAIEPGTELPIHRHRSTSETVVCLRGRFLETFYDDEGSIQRYIWMTPGKVLNIPIGQWHSLKSDESGTVLLECKDGPYEPLSDEDILEK